METHRRYTKNFVCSGSEAWGGDSRLSTPTVNASMQLGKGAAPVFLRKGGGTQTGHHAEKPTCLIMCHRLLLTQMGPKLKNSLDHSINGAVMSSYKTRTKAQRRMEKDLAQEGGVGLVGKTNEWRWRPADAMENIIQEPQKAAVCL